jgi:hypothetical protein
MTGYWRRLLKTGLFLSFLASILVFASAAEGATRNEFGTPSGYNGILLFLAGVLGVIGQILFLPGVIGWGIDSSGLTALVAASQQPVLPPLSIAYPENSVPRQEQVLGSIVPDAQQSQLPHSAAHRR